MGGKRRPPLCPLPGKRKARLWETEHSSPTAQTAGSWSWEEEQALLMPRPAGAIENTTLYLADLLTPLRLHLQLLAWWLEYGLVALKEMHLSLQIVGSHATKHSRIDHWTILVTLRFRRDELLTLNLNTQPFLHRTKVDSIGIDSNRVRKLAMGSLPDPPIPLLMWLHWKRADSNSLAIF